MDSPVEYIQRNPKYKYWTLYTDKDKRVASHDDDDDPVKAFSEMYGFLSTGSYRLLIRKTDRADRGSMSVTFKKEDENQFLNMAFGQQSSPGGLGLSPFELGIQLGQIRAEQERQRALMARLEKVLPFLEELAENEKTVMKALLDLTDEDDENDDDAFEKVSQNIPKITSIVSNVRSIMAKGG
ncbi:MAG: hypothetical protein U0X91_30745 [Spirosomataceae bacterium]